MWNGIVRPIQSRQHHAYGPPRNGPLRCKVKGLRDAAQGITELPASGELEAEIEVRFRILRIEFGRLAKHNLGKLAAS